MQGESDMTGTEIRQKRWGADGRHRSGASPDETFCCPFCGHTARIATFCLDGDEWYQALCDSCGTGSYFNETKQGAMDAWMKKRD